MIEAEELLIKCSEILQERGEQYGDAHDLYKITARLWSGYLQRPVTPGDVCLLMALMKIGRLAHGVEGDAADDTFTDSINYIALAKGLD